jgi:hypothetical protein
VSGFVLQFILLIDLPRNRTGIKNILGPVARLLARSVRCLKSLCLVFLATVATASQAQLLDRIELLPAPKNEVEIVLRLSATVLYQRHAPVGGGTELRIYMRMTGIDTGTAVREYLHSPPAKSIPAFRVSFPENDGSMLVTFANRTDFRVVQGRDSRSMSIFVPVAQRESDPGSSRASAKAREAVVQRR